MLDFTQLDRVDADTITYAGEYFYIITRDKFSLVVIVEDLDDNGDVYDKARYAASTLSAAIATISRITSSCAPPTAIVFIGSCAASFSRTARTFMPLLPLARSPGASPRGSAVPSAPPGS